MQNLCRSGRTTFFKLSLISLGILLTQQVALANESQQLDEVNVTTVADVTSTEQTKSYTTSAMKTTTGLELSPKETPQSVSVITKTQLKHQGITSITEALRHTTGVNVVQNGTRPQYYSRGFVMNQIEEDGIASMVPGVLLNSYSDPQSLSDIAIYDHIEVLRGAAGLTQGTGEPGGTINVVRKKPTVNTQASINASIDRFGSFRTVGDISGSINEAQTVHGRLITLGERNRSFKDDVDGSKKMIYGVIDFNLGDSTLLTLGGLYQNEHSTPDPFGLQMGDGRNLNLPYDTFLGADWNKSKARKYNVFVEVEHYFNDDWKLTNKFSYTKSRYSQQQGGLGNSSNSYAGVGLNNLLSVTGRLSRWEDKGHQTAFQSNLTGIYSFFNRQHDLFLTYTYSQENLHSFWRQFADSTEYNIYTFDGGIPYPDFNVGPYRFREYDDYTLTSHGVALGTQFHILDNLHLLAGTRYTHWNSDYNEVWYGSDGVTPNYSPNLKKRSRFIPYLGLTWDIDEHFSAYASWTSIFKPQLSAKDKDGKTLPPVIGNNYEIGLKSAWFDNQLNTSIALFKILQKNRAISISRAQAQAIDPNATSGYSILGGEVESRGVDLEISGNLTKQWKLFAGYTFNMSKYRSTESTTYTAGMNFSKHTPKHIFRLYTAFNTADEKWTFGGGADYQSKTGSLNNIEQGGYVLWNANIEYKVNKNLTLALVGKNLLDKRYYENNRVRNKGMNNFYGEPRNFVFSVDYKF